MKVLRAIITSLLITSFLAVPVFATGSLDDVVNEVEVGQEAQTGEETQAKPKKGASQSFVEGIEQAGNVSANMGDANKVAAPLKEGVGFIVGILATAIPLLLVLRVMLDLLYIFIPFSRSLLGGGAPQQSSGGMGGMGGGMGGFGGGGFGGGRGMSGGGGQQQSSGGIQWISNQALNAVAAESGGQQSSGGMGGFGGGMSQQPQGGGQSAFKIYSKDMVITLAVAPIMLILAISGVLTSLGAALGVAAVSAIQNLIGMI